MEQAAAPEVEHRYPRRNAGSETILLVEDEDMVRKLVRETLEHEGYKILEAAGPEQARKICRNYEGPIHLMITDVVMPKENGRVLAGAAGEERPDMKVLFMSGYTDTGIRQRRGRQVEFLQKPFTPAALAESTHVLKPANGDKCRHAGG